MTRTLFHGGTVFDGTGAPLAAADVVVEDGRIVDVAPGLDGSSTLRVAGSTRCGPSCPPIISPNSGRSIDA